MPTGYTAYIKDGEITTGKEFLKLCTRAFGIAIDLKDEPLSVPTKTHYEPNSYYKENYEKTTKVRDRMRQLTFEEAKQQIIDKYNEDITHAKKCLDMYKTERAYQRWQEELKRVADKNKWMKQFLDSLENI